MCRAACLVGMQQQIGVLVKVDQTKPMVTVCSIDGESGTYLQAIFGINLWISSKLVIDGQQAPLIALDESSARNHLFSKHSIPFWWSWLCYYFCFWRPFNTGQARGMRKEQKDCPFGGSEPTMRHCDADVSGWLQVTAS
jgi:hypothetical protein